MNRFKKIFVLITTAAIFTAPVSFASEPNSLFDGKTLAGWKPFKAENAAFWKVANGVITGSNHGEKVPTNTYLVYDGDFSDFEFRCKFRISGDHQTGLINSGIQYRSLEKNGKMTGYQADIGRGYWGDIYDEHRRGKLAKGDTSKLMDLLKEDGWNDYLIRCKGKRHELYINGVKTVTFMETEDVPNKGFFALQLHSGGVAKVEFKEITITKLD